MVTPGDHCQSRLKDLLIGFQPNLREFVALSSDYDYMTLNSEDERKLCGCLDSLSMLERRLKLR